MSAIPPVVLRPEEPAERPFHYSRSVDVSVPDVVDVYWSVQWALPPGEHHDHDVVTHPCSHVTVEAGRAWVQGVVTERFTRRLVGRGRVVGAKLVPSGLSSLTGVPPASVTARRVPAQRLLGDVSALADAVTAAHDVASGIAAMDAWFRDRDPVRSDGGAFVDGAVELAAAERGLTRVDDLAAALHVTVRTLQHRFDRYLGVGPKWVLRRCRIQDALTSIEAGDRVDWADLARRLGFADQSHFVGSFTALVGTSPGRYAHRPPHD